MSGKNQIERALQEFEAGNFSQAESLARESEANFSLVVDMLERLKGNSLIKLSPGLTHQISNYSNLSKSALLVSKSIRQGSGLLLQFQGIVDYSDIHQLARLDDSERVEMLRLLYEADPEVRGVNANLGLALMKLSRMDEDLPFFPFKEELKRAEEQLFEARESLNHLIDISSLMTKLAGYPRTSNFLVFFQNSDELRPTGGFLGTYGILSVKDGDIERFDTHNIYHMDMPLEGILEVEPPEPIKKYLNRNWYMRDANWSPDWPTSAEKLNWFFHKEDQLLPPENQINEFTGEFDGVIAVTPDFVKDLIAITGPLEVEGEVYDKDNFVDVLQYQVQRGYPETDRSAWERKEVVGEILTSLQEEIFNLPDGKWPSVTPSVKNSLFKKDILFYFFEDYYQDIAKGLDWTGHIKDTPGDYLMVVDSNMAALKTDSVIERGFNYSLDQSLNGLFVDLRINYSHHGEPSWKISEYKSYTRVLTPLGSELLEIERNNLGPATDPDIKISEVGGKTSFETFFTLQPGEVGSLHLRYKLPEDLEEAIERSDSYSLLVQKQPGTILKNSLIDISTNNKIKSYNPQGFYVNLKDDYSVSWRSDIVGDKKIEIIFEN